MRRGPVLFAAFFEGVYIYKKFIALHLLDGEQYISTVFSIFQERTQLYDPRGKKNLKGSVGGDRPPPPLACRQRKSVSDTLSIPFQPASSRFRWRADFIKQNSAASVSEGEDPGTVKPSVRIPPHLDCTIIPSQ